jgi:hypothetical protein
MIVNLVQAYFLGVLSVDLIHDFPGKYLQEDLNHGKEYYCNLYRGLFQLSGILRVHLPMCIASALLLNKALVRFHGFPAESRKLYLWVTAILSFPGLFVYGLCGFLVANACSVERATNQVWRETLFRLGICHILMISLLLWSIYTLSRGERLARLAQQREINKGI